MYNYCSVAVDHRTVELKHNELKWRYKIAIKFLPLYILGIF